MLFPCHLFEYRQAGQFGRRHVKLSQVGEADPLNFNLHLPRILLEHLRVVRKFIPGHVRELAPSAVHAVGFSAVEGTALSDFVLAVHVRLFHQLVTPVSERTLVSEAALVQLPVAADLRLLFQLEIGAGGLEVLVSTQ